MADDKGKCKHEGCQCMGKDENSGYCSMFCKDADGTTALQCDCGHPGCKAQTL